MLKARLCHLLLSHHGHFLRAKLYPKNVLSSLEIAKDAVLSYSKVYDKITKVGYKSIGQAQFNIWAVLVIIGFMDRENYNDQLLDPHRGFLNTLKQTEPQLSEEFPRECKKLSDAMRQLTQEIEGFFLDNQLEEYRESNFFERSGLTY